MGVLVSILLILIYTVLVGLVITYVSTVIGTAIMILLPLIGAFVAPGWMGELLSYELVSMMNGAISIQNIHILLAIWVGFLSVVAYTEFISWYLGEMCEEEAVTAPESTLNHKDESDPDGAAEIPPSPVETEELLEEEAPEERSEIREIKEIAGEWKRWKEERRPSDGEKE